MNYPIYRNLPSNDLLCQGDILDPCRLRNNLRGHQDYFADRPYFYRYMVLTQTCDLVRGRKGSDFIFLAVVRRLRDAFGIRPVAAWWSSSKNDDLLEDIFKHNYNRRGFFYLPRDAQQGIEEDSVVDLRVMFSLYKDHYESLLQARLGALTEIYAAKIGHLAGYMFSRVATPGWDELSPGRSISDHIKAVRENVKVREQEVLKQLIERANGRCTLNGCSNRAITYRLIHSDESALCEEHAKQWDEGALAEDSI